MLQVTVTLSYYQTTPYMVHALALHGLCVSAGEAERKLSEAEGTRKL
jgi:hypothetical protein